MDIVAHEACRKREDGAGSCEGRLREKEVTLVERGERAACCWRCADLNVRLADLECCPERARGGLGAGIRQ